MTHDISRLYDEVRTATRALDSLVARAKDQQHDIELRSDGNAQGATRGVRMCINAVLEAQSWLERAAAQLTERQP